MPPLPSRKVLESMKRADLQKLCKDYGVKANLKSEALIDLLLHTQTGATSRRQPSSSNPQSKLPPNRRAVPTRQFSRAGTTRVSPMTIRDMSDEHTGTNKNICTEADGQKADQCGAPLPGPSQPQSQPQSTSIEVHRTRKVKEQQGRLGVGKPVAAGVAGQRTVTRSTTQSKGKQVNFSRAVKPDAATPEEENSSGPSPEPIQGLGMHVDITAPAIAKVGMSDSLSKLANVDEVVANALRPLHEQFQTLRAELEQMRLMKSELAQLKHEVDKLKSHTSLNNFYVNPVTPKSKDPSPKKPFGYGGLEMSSLEAPQSRAVSHHTLGKRPRDPFETNVEDSGHRDDEQGREQDDLPIPKKAKTSRFDDDLIADMVDDHDNPEAMESSRSRAPAFNVFQEQNDALQTSTTSLSDYLIIPSPSAASATECGRHDVASTVSETEDQNMSTFPFAPTSQMRTPQVPPHRQTLYGIPAFPFPEPPQSPTPSSSGTGRNEFDPNDEKRTDMFQSLGLPPLDRPAPRMPSTINPSALTTRKDAEASIARNVGFGLRMIPSSSSVASMQLDAEDAPSKRVTMYGTELDGDTRFGDFGFEGIATGFWTGGRF